MSKSPRELFTCAVCGGSFPRADVVPGGGIRDTIANEIRREHAGWSERDFICREDLGRFRASYVHRILESEKGELSTLEQEVVRSLQEHELLATNVEEDLGRTWTFGERLADRIASFGGSWRFLIIFSTFLAIWIVLNSLVALWRPVDPYPYILLNLLLSCLAAIQAPVIMMSQNRQQERDRIRSEHDYSVNLKAELEIRHLHEKVDHLLSQQWERLVAIQELQMELLNELARRRS